MLLVTRQSNRDVFGCEDSDQLGQLPEFNIININFGVQECALTIRELDSVLSGSLGKMLTKNGLPTIAT